MYPKWRTAVPCRLAAVLQGPEFLHFGPGFASNPTQRRGRKSTLASQLYYKVQFPPLVGA